MLYGVDVMRVRCVVWCWCYEGGVYHVVWTNDRGLQTHTCFVFLAIYTTWHIAYPKRHC